VDDSYQKELSTSTEKVYSFSFTQQNAPKKSIEHSRYDHAVRTAECILPDSEEVEAQVKSQLSEFDEDSWVGHIGGPKDVVNHTDRFELEEVEKNKVSKDSDFQLMSDCGWFCGTVWLTVTTSGGQLISIVIECDSNSWVYECAPPSGGSGLEYPIGEEPACEDPTMPCYDGSGGAENVEPCEWMLNPPVNHCSWQAEFPVLDGDDDYIQESVSLPDCNESQIEPWKLDYCNSSEPSGVRLSKTNTALDRIEDRGPECETIANLGRSILGDGQLRFYPRPNRTWGVAGGRGLPNVVGHENGVVLLMDEWVDDWFYNSQTAIDSDGTIVNVNFDFALTHEIEHAMEREHLSGSAWRTPNAQKCSGLN